MRLFFRTALFSLLLFSFLLSQGQGIPIGAWRDHFPYKNSTFVSEGQGVIYCATPYAAFSYNKQDNSFERLTKITGFSDFGVSTLSFNPYNNSLMIAYANANIDIVQNKTITNLSDIKRKPIIGNKNINGIYYINQFAYLACGFGIVVFDTDKKEVKDTYFIGANGGNINVLDITSDGTSLFAATDSGVYKAALNNPNLANFTAWNKFNQLPKGSYNTIACFNGKVLTNYSKRITTGAWMQDTIFVYNGSQWNYFSQISGYNTKNIEVTNGSLVISMEYNVNIYDNSYNIVKQVTGYGFAGPVPKDAITDNNGVTWVADAFLGLVKVSAPNTGEALFPNGPSSIGVYAMSVVKENLWITPGSVTGSYSNTYNFNGVSKFIDNTWSIISGAPALDTIFDILNVAINPEDEKNVFVTSWSRGVIEFQNGALKAVYNEKNSSLLPIILGNYYTLRTDGIAFDKDNNLWVANSGAAYPVSVRKPDGSWKSIDFSSFINTSAVLTQMIVTTAGQKWILLEKGEGILLYEDKGTMATATPSNTKKLNLNKGNGGLPSNGVYSIAEDHNGEVWVGTDKGLAVFYSPESIFGGGSSNWDAQQILIEQDEHVQILFETEVINSIVVDGANRKWIGTAASGVYLMSADGQKELHHFTTENSPLPSNEVICITLDQKSGEVFFGTLNGIVSYRSTATEGLEDFENVYAFPNPVRENYDGVIAIKGLVKDVDVKITDITGTLIYQTKALGGQATWDGKNFKGDKAHTGVYLVFCTNEDGSKTFVTKILFIN